MRQGELVAEAAPPGPDNPLVSRSPRSLGPRPSIRTPSSATRCRARCGAGPARFADRGSYDDPASEPLLLDDHEIVTGWDADIDRLLTEAIESRSGDQLVELPASCRRRPSSTACRSGRLRCGPGAADAAPTFASARFGTRFHHWLERYFGARLPTADWDSNNC